MVNKPKQAPALAQAGGSLTIETSLLKGPGAAGKVTATGIVFDDSIQTTLADFTATGKALVTGLAINAFAIGDLLNYGKRKFPDQYESAAKTFGLEYGTLRNYASVAAKFPVEKRRAALSMEHHRLVAALPTAEAEKFLDRAEADKLSASALRNITPKGDAKPKKPATLNTEAIAHAEALLVALGEGNPVMLMDGMGDKWFGKTGFLFRLSQACVDMEASHADMVAEKEKKAQAAKTPAAAAVKGK